ncbi:MAG: PocR ligand-binding domain-containing protein [Prolixibacteraceae bacterium]|nr:PocR ligand-binding domain-containing protein [Prolixibacteraceae bacterium]
MKPRVIDYIDFDRVNTLLEGFNQSTGFVTAILDLEGNVLSKSGWRQLCTDFHRVNAETAQRCTISDTVLAGKMGKGEKYHCYKCMNGLIDVAVPILIKGEHIANLFSGQFFFEQPDYDFFKKQAARFGFDEVEYLKSLAEVPVISEEKVKNIMDFLLDMTLLISEMTYQRMELIKLNDTLRESEETYRMLYENLNDAVFTSALNEDGTIGKFVHVNDIACHRLGYTREELLTKSAYDINSENTKMLVAQRTQLFLNNRRVVYETEHLTKDGKIIPVEVSTNVANFKGKTLIHSIARDISQRKQAEEELQKREAIIRTAVENLPVIFYQIDKNGIFQLSVGAGLKSLGLQPNQVVGYSVFDIYKDYPEILDAVKRALQNEIATFESHVNEAYHYNILTPLPNLGIIGVAMDITEMKDTFRKLEQSREDYIKLFEDHAAVKFLIDPFTGQIIDSNYAAEQYYGWSRDELKKMNVSQINTLSREQVENALNKAIIANKLYFEFKHKLANGSIRDVEVFTSKINFDGKEVLHSIVHDITDRKKAEAELVVAKEKAEESDRLKTAFLQNMSHEIRTPMNAIMGFSELLFDCADDKEKLKSYTDIINLRCNDLLDIINDILDISKIESGQLPVNIGETNLNDLFKELSSFFIEYQHRLNKQHIEFNLLAFNNPEKNLILTDKVKLKQIFINLISNAFKFTDEGKIEGGCKLDENQNLLFYVSDTGAGIPVNKHQFIFDRFTQIQYEGKKNIGGTGLGLPIVKALVNLLGGTISLESETGKGSTFWFTLPYKPVRKHDTQVDKDNRDNSFHFSGKTVLIVEDDPFNAEYIAEVLSRSGLRILQSENGEDAITKTISQNIDLILMDIRLPDINGYQAIERIKKVKPAQKIIAQTAYASHDEELKALNIGCVDYLSKPIKKDILLAKLGKHLN